MKQPEYSYTVGTNVNWYSIYGEQYEDYLKKIGIKLPYDPVILLCGIYPEEIITEKDTCTPMFFAALFTILGHESNLDVHQQINEYGSYSTYTQWNITQL